MKMTRGKNNYLQSTTQKTKDWATLKSRGEFMCFRRVCCGGTGQGICPKDLLFFFCPKPQSDITFIEYTYNWRTRNGYQRDMFSFEI